MIPEAPLIFGGRGLEPEGDGWFVLNAREARWQEGDFGAFMALYTLSPFVLSGPGVESAFETKWGDVFTAWSADRSLSSQARVDGGVEVAAEGRAVHRR